MPDAVVGAARYMLLHLAFMSRRLPRLLEYLCDNDCVNCVRFVDVWMLSRNKIEIILMLKRPDFGLLGMCLKRLPPRRFIANMCSLWYHPICRKELRAEAIAIRYNLCVTQIKNPA